MAPEEVEHAKVNEKSKVFTAAMSLVNFLYSVYENKKNNNNNNNKDKDNSKKSKKTKDDNIGKYKLN